MMRMSRIQKVTNALLLLFPVFFAIMVYYSFKNEDSMQINYTKQEEKSVECGDSLFMNISFAVILAAVWNGKKIIKVGTL
jgi:Ca2+/Na+ antiporter